MIFDGVNCIECHRDNYQGDRKNCPRCHGTGLECPICGSSYDPKLGCTNSLCSSFRNKKKVV
jgi:hypothetical protein